ncbi:MAG TPA: VWA domain-containing protein [Thermoanaerobaculia bacterium]|nr:VWA domain-containing protein [Thermoanaerobaculia bacterium]
MPRQSTRHPVRLVALLVAAAITALAAAPAAEALDEYSKKQEEQIAALPPDYQSWLRDVEVIISEEEFDSFVALEKDYQRDAFIERFWRVRDRYSDTARNEFEERYQQRLAEAKQAFGGIDSDRSRILLLNGYPTGRLEVRCTSVLRPLDIWFYAGSDQVHFNFWVVFYREGANYKLWRPFDGIERLTESFLAENIGPGGGGGGPGGMRGFLNRIVRNCRDGEQVASGIAYVLSEGDLAYGQILGRIQETPKIAGKEWVETFNAYTTELPEDALLLQGDMELRYPGRRQNRTAVQGTVALEREGAGVAELAGSRSYNFLLTGEVISDGRLFDTFRYKFDFPASGLPGEKVPLVFQRFLRPGDYQLLVKVEDLNSGKYYREERAVSVPQADELLPPPPMDEETARLLAEANAALASGETTVQIVQPRGQLHTGYLRFDTLTTGDDIERVSFALDGDELLIKRTPPYSVDLDLGRVPQPRTLSAVAYDSTGEPVAEDELLLNAGGHRFNVDLIEPRRGKKYERSLSAEVAVEVPEGTTAERVEFYLNETLVASLYQEPWVQPIVLPEGEPIAYVRAVAYLTDGNSTEDLVFVNAPDYLEEIDIQFVELFATVVDREERPLEGFDRDDFTVIEDGVPQQIARFERVSNLPIHAGILLDVSASMRDNLDQAQRAALSFFQQAIEPKDRASVITFNDHPNLAVEFTNDVDELAGGLAGLKAERGTSLFDSVIFSLYYFNGIKGQRALLILSDGKDESSRFTWEQALEYARRAGVTIYSISLGEADHKKLSRLAATTGGRGFKIAGVEELPEIYDAIQEELRSKYLIAYQSSNTTESKDFRSIVVKVAKSGADVKAMQGYYP